MGALLHGHFLTLVAARLAAISVALPVAFSAFPMVALFAAPVAAFLSPQEALAARARGLEGEIEGPLPGADPEPPPPSLDREGLVRIAPAPPSSPAALADRAPYFHRYDRALAPRVGVGLDTKELADNNQLVYLVGAQYEFPGSEGVAYAVGTDILSNNRGAFSLARLFRTQRGRARPYARAGAGLEVGGSEGLAGFLTYQNAQLRAAGGLELTLLAETSIRFEVEATASVRTQQAIAFSGFAFAW